jgi:hypothetical protein
MESHAYTSAEIKLGLYFLHIVLLVLNPGLLPVQYLYISTCLYTAGVS